MPKPQHTWIKLRADLFFYFHRSQDIKLNYILTSFTSLQAGFVLVYRDILFINCKKHHASCACYVRWYSLGRSDVVVISRNLNLCACAKYGTFSNSNQQNQDWAKKHVKVLYFRFSFILYIVAAPFTQLHNYTFLFMPVFWNYVVIYFIDRKRTCMPLGNFSILSWISNLSHNYLVNFVHVHPNRDIKMKCKFQHLMNKKICQSFNSKGFSFMSSNNSFLILT